MYVCVSDKSSFWLRHKELYTNSQRRDNPHSLANNSNTTSTMNLSTLGS